jgi:hypothetical protein
VIQHIKELAAELQGQLFTDFEIAMDTQIPLKRSETSQSITSEIALAQGIPSIGV